MRKSDAVRYQLITEFEPFRTLRSKTHLTLLNDSNLNESLDFCGRIVATVLFVTFTTSFLTIV